MAKMVEKWAKSGCTGAAARARTHAACRRPCVRARGAVRRCARRTRVCADCHAVYNAALLSWPQRPRWPMPKLAMGRKKATTAGAVNLTRIQKEKLRQRGYLYPATVKALRALRPARGYPVVPGVQRYALYQNYRKRIREKTNEIQALETYNHAMLSNQNSTKRSLVN